MLDKKVIVLKKVSDGYSVNATLSAILRLENEDGVTTLFFSPVNFKGLTHGEYILFIIDNLGNIHKLPLGLKPLSITHTFDVAISVNGFSAGVVVVDGDIPLLIAFQRESSCNVEIIDFKRKIADYLLQQKKAREKKERELETIYNDEVVATENYFLPQNQSQEIDEINNSQSIGDEISGDIQPENGNIDSQCKEEEKKGCENADTCKDEKTSYSEQEPYYLKVKDELDKVLSSFERESSLSKTFPFSTFVKVPYSEGKYYTVGLIRRGNAPKYICYGVPSNYSKTPPKELDGYCTFIPLSIFNIHGEGYFMMFQDAISGECVTINS